MEKRVRSIFESSSPKMEHRPIAKTARPSLGSQVTELERERDEAKRAEALLKTRVADLEDDLKVQAYAGQRNRKEWQQHVTELKQNLGIANRDLRARDEELRRLKSRQQKSQKEKLEQIKGVAKGAIKANKILKDKDKATAAAIDAMKQFLSKHKEITGDSFFGMGKEFDRLRASINDIPIIELDDGEEVDGTRRRAGYMDGSMFVVLGDLEEAMADDDDRLEFKEEEDDDDSSPLRKRVKRS